MEPRVACHFNEIVHRAVRCVHDEDDVHGTRLVILGGIMKHLRHVAARLLGKTRMGGFYVYWAIAE
jgi:hypothetical protein